MSKLTLIRGLPGSGKSTLAKEYHEATPGSVWVELMRKAWEECDSVRHPNDKTGLPLDVQLDELYIEDAHLRDGDSPQ